MTARPLNIRTTWPAILSLGALLAAGLSATAEADAASTERVPLGPATDRPLDPSQLEALPAEMDSGQGKQVTLVTGDRVRVGFDADGKPTVQEFIPAQTSERPSVSQATLARGEDLYVVPSDALPLLAADRLDWDLFNVAYLAANGYTDDEADQLPLIVQYNQPATRRTMNTQARALPASTPEHTLESIDAVALDVDKEQAGAFWSAVNNPEVGFRSTATLDRGVGKIWLDRKMEVSLDESVPQVGAPEAWAAGYDGTGVTVAVLDTGIDATHPDVTGKIVASRSFVAGVEEPVDGHGHGTHVAATAAGTGDASDGLRKGVAPGADLMIGKVLDDSGNGNFSQIIDGMEWAAAQGADVVNMSVGGDPTDGTDPASQAVNELSAEYGTLFVVSAGNSGPGASTVGTPGAADAALTVAAVDKNDQLAGFSSRGPRAGDRGLKPDISAPGVDIVAARAAGTSMPSAVHVGDNYTTVSGTSMAAPHVAGAAAILAQQHRGWTGEQLKDALMSTTEEVGHSVYEQGTGRLDVARAVDQGVYANGSLDFGRLPFPQNQPLTQTITYTNTTSQPVTLDLTTSLSTFAGDPVPEGVLSLDQDEVSVPGHGTASVAVTLDLAVAEAGAYQGTVRATDPTGTIHLTSTVGVYLEPESFDLTVQAIAPEGARDFTVGSWLIVRMDGRTDLDDGPVTLPAGAQATTRLPKGTYTVLTSTSWRDAAGERNYALPTHPEITVDNDRTVRSDLREAKKISVETPQPTENYDAWFGHQRIAAGNSWNVTAQQQTPYGQQNYWMLPTDPVTEGEFGFHSQHLLGAPPITMRALGGGSGVELHPRYQTPGISMSVGGPQVPKLDGRDRPKSLAYAGNGLPDDFEDIDSDGAIVLLNLADVCAPTCDGQAVERVQNAAAAGATAVLISGASGRVSPGTGTYPIPTMSLPAAEARTLIDRLEQRPVKIRFHGQAETPYLYSLKFTNDDKVPADLTHRVSNRDLHQIDNRVHADRPGQAVMSWQAKRAFPYGEDSVVQDLTGLVKLTIKAQRTLVEFVGPVSDDLLWLRDGSLTYDAPASVPLAERGGGSERGTLLRVFPESGHDVEHWYASPWVPGVLQADDATWAARPAFVRLCVVCRSGDTLWPVFYPTSGSSGHSHGWNWRSTQEISLYRDGQAIRGEVRQVRLVFLVRSVQAFTLPASPGSYRLMHRYNEDRWFYPMQLYSTGAETTWEFTSQRPTGGPPTDHGCIWDIFSNPNNPMDACRPEPLLYLNYDLGLNLDNTLPAARSHTITISGYHNQLVSPEPDVTDLDLEVSFDDGATWKQVATKPAEDNTFTARIKHPKLEDTAGAVSLRVQAEDADGNTIEQTIERAYGLK